MLEFKKYKLFIYKNNQFIKIKPVIFKDDRKILQTNSSQNLYTINQELLLYQDIELGFYPYIAKEIDVKILQTNSSQNLYTINQELLLCL